MYSEAHNTKLLLSPREAAHTLSVSEKSLWLHTTPRGPIPCVRLGRSVRYSVDALKAYLSIQERLNQTAEAPAA